MTSSAVGIQLGCNSSSFRSAEACDGQLTIVGTIQATLPCDLKTFRCRLIWLGMLALAKTEQVDRPTALFPEMGCSKSACSTGHYRQSSTTFGAKAKSASPTMTAMTSSDQNCQYVEKIESSRSEISRSEI